MLVLLVGSAGHTGTGLAHVVRDADPQRRVAARGAQVHEPDLLAPRHRDEHTPGRLGEQCLERRHAVARADGVERHTRTDAEPQARLDERLGEAALGEVVGRVDQVVSRGVDQDLREGALGREVDPRREPAEVGVHDVRPRRAVQLSACGAEQVDRQSRDGPARRCRAGDVVDHAEDPDDRRRMDRGVDLPRLAGAVVQRDVPAGDRDAEGLAGVRETLDGLHELPHRVRVLGRAEVQAVGDRERARARGGDVAVRLGEGELGAGVRVELGPAAVRVGRERDAEPGGLVDADHAAVVRLGQARVALHEPVVLVGDPGLRGQVRRAEQAQQRRPEPLRGRRTRVLRVGVGPAEGRGVEAVLPRRARVRPVVDGALVGDGARQDVDDLHAVVVDHEATGVGDLADDGGLDVPLAGDREELVELGRGDDGHHALLRLRHEDLAGRQARVAQQHLVELDVHAAVAVARELARRARDPGGPEVLDALDDVRREELEAALDEHLLHERVADLDARPLGRLRVVEGLARQDRRAADAVAARARAEQHDLVPDARRVREVDVLVPEHPHAQRVHERVALVGGVEDDLAADVREPQAVAVAADPGDHAVHDAGGVRVVDRAEPQLVHDRHRARAHRDDVADDPADAGRGTLVRLDEARVVVGLDLERDGPAVADVDDARVLADADEQVLLHRRRRLVAERAEVHLRGLVRAVLGPHHRVHRELGRGRAAAEEVVDLLILLGLETELRVGHLLVGSGLGIRDGVEGHGLGGRSGGRRGHRIPHERPAQTTPRIPARPTPPAHPTRTAGRGRARASSARPPGMLGPSGRPLACWDEGAPWERNARSPAPSSSASRTAG
ncbi:hypothetical protein GALL_384550 [mine drainage metagenome]|uniref:Uncharacterized protein n=1 Tax=mine drainage metagenome TaxID=410659 RepID=A0A1J5QV80_9ZZZZ